MADKKDSPAAECPAKKKLGCISCKVISVGAFIGIGLYLAYHGTKQNPPAKFVLYGLGAASAALGVADLCNKSPLRKQEKEK